ncbi:HAD-IB family hydrolase [Halioglobus maricola]|uniref:HAD-IB family hydrolase n=1 Tax=Halioglobus maricola TaxID=2601894 RepID=A0A5P9NK48_9GAMM|nr:HAD-IB family hydrolase [Halioglobus maricola]
MLYKFCTALMSSEEEQMTPFSEHLDKIPSLQHGAGRRVAFFDLDRTLISGYSIMALAQETARHAASTGDLRQSARLIRDVVRQKVDPAGGNYHRVVKRVARAITGLSEATLTDLGQRACSRHLERTLYREAIELIETHRNAGDYLVIVTAATRYQVEPLADILGVDEICCTQLEVQNGCFTGEVVAPLCYGEGKSLSARRVVRQQKATLSRSWFYTDSSADLPLLQAVGHPVAVNASDKLAVHARNHKWPQLEFSSRGQPGIEQIARTGAVAQALLTTTLAGRASLALGTSRLNNANRLTRLFGDIGSGIAGLEYEVDGREHLRSQRPAVYVFNHQSLLDSMVMAHLLRDDVVALCKKEMASNPLIGPLLKQVDTIFVDRDDRDQSDVIHRALEVLASGRSLVIAPEGTRSTLGKVQPFKMGAFILARKAGVPLVPIVLHNVKDALPKGGKVIRSATIRVSVLPPIAPEDMRGIRKCCAELEQTYSAVLDNSPVAALPFSASA